ncbi:MAG: LuxR C-terminal-related transcriptional regulator [Muribaculum sp.]|nr:LuxR C-terminal-related transcriptional regulator [Muribaculum sp.]
MKRISISLLHYSPIISAGITAIINQLKEVNISINHVTLHDLDKNHSSVIIADPLLISAEKVDELRAGTSGKLRVVALYSSALPAEILRVFDSTISIYDSIDTIESTLRQIIAEEEDEEEKILSQREKDVVVGIVKGLSNKEIAVEMGVSVNTVMTHRRNIASKLQIHSPAGLTIYAIVSKLVQLDEIKSQLPR